LTLIVNHFNPDIISVTETWLHNDIPDVHLYLKDYVIFRKDRIDGYGGVMLAVKSYLNPQCFHVQSNLEIVLVDIFANEHRLRVGVAYRPPSYSSALKEPFAKKYKL
jgi:exonuclease III